MDLYIEDHITYSYSSMYCEETTGEANIISSKSLNTLLHKSITSNELLSML